MNRPDLVRRPCVAGQFYPDDPEELRRLLSSFKVSSASKREAIGCLLPHAGYIYSGKVAAQTLAEIKIRDTLILIGPNHTGNGPDFSLMPAGSWQTPFGNVEIDADLAGLFLARCEHLKSDTFAHIEEHSLEVELPILQYFRKDFKIVPITIKTDSLSALKAVSDDLSAVIAENGLKDKCMLIASSDMTHYESLRSAEKKDALAIKAITGLDEDGLEKAVRGSSISMCGFAPAVILVRSARHLGAKIGRLVKYQTSGDVSGDISSVVGYAGITIS